MAAPAHRGSTLAAVRLILVALFGALLAGCATTGEKSSIERYPPALIAAAEPLAPAVGFVVSHVQWRQGYLSAHPQVLATLQRRLRPLDLLVFSSRGRLSGRTGSGLFGHSAVYLGTERQLRALGMWDDPAVVPHRAEIRAGNTIIEAGQLHDTVLAPPSRMANTDRLALMRPADRGGAWRRKALRTLFSSVGKRFDHHFRLSEHETLYCTELIDLAFPELRLPRHPAYGREIILPDDLALKAARPGGGVSLVWYARGTADGWTQGGARTLISDIEAAGK